MSKERLTRRDFLKTVVKSVEYTGVYCLGNSLGGKNEAEKSEFVINERMSEIVSQIEPLGFNPWGNLVCPDGEISLIPTHRNEVERIPIEEVKLLVVHYDAGERYRASGIERNARNTVWGLNGNDPDGNGLGPSVHWCVDNFPIARNESGEGGYGVLQTQIASGNADRPYAGLHLGIDPIYDPNRVRTSQRLESLGIRSNLSQLIEQEIENFNLYSLGYEQIGIYFEERFPSEGEPPSRQFANTLSLAIAVMEKFGLNPWDIVGHHEIQQKSDPGDYHMATFRFLLGLAALSGKVSADIVFCEDTPREYFGKVARYLEMVDRYGRYNEWKNWVGFDSLFDSLPIKAPGICQLTKSSTQ